LSDFETRISAVEQRLAVLEKMAHPPVDLRGPVFRTIAAILREAAEEAEAKIDE